MAGNAWEWVADWYDKNYYNSQSTWDNPHGPGNIGSKVLRGGSWNNAENELRSTDRYGYDPNKPYYSISFRCIHEAE